MSETAPELRTPEAIYRKHEQILHGLETGAVSPKTGEQLNMTMKGIWRLLDLRFRYFQTFVKYGNRTPVVKDPLLLRFLGEAPQTSFAREAPQTSFARERP